MSEYRYGMRLRGYSIGCQPLGVIAREDDPTGRYYDILVYDSPLKARQIEAYDLDYIGEEGAEMKYYIVDCISGYHDEDDEPYTSLKEARAECERMNREAIKEGHKPDFWLIIDSNGNEVE